MEDQSQMDLMSPDDATQLSQLLISPELALAFGITKEEILQGLHVNQKLLDSLSTIFPNKQFYYPNDFRVGSFDLSSNEDMDDKKKEPATKKARLAWTAELHKKFVESIKQLGSDKAVPKTILEVMNVEGVTRENIASHLQKYRSHLKNLEKEKEKEKEKEEKSDEGCLKDPSEVTSMGMEHSNVHPCPSHEHDYGQLHQPSLQHGSVPFMVPPPWPYGYGHGYGHMGMPMSKSMPMAMPMFMPMTLPPPPPGYNELEPKGGINKEVN